MYVECNGNRLSITEKELFLVPAAVTLVRTGNRSAACGEWVRFFELRAPAVGLRKGVIRHVGLVGRRPLRGELSVQAPKTATESERDGSSLRLMSNRGHPLTSAAADADAGAWLSDAPVNYTGPR